MHSVDHFSLRHVEGVHVANSEAMLDLLGVSDFTLRILDPPMEGFEPV